MMTQQHISGDLNSEGGGSSPPRPRRYFGPMLGTSRGISAYPFIPDILSALRAAAGRTPGSRAVLGTGKRTCADGTHQHTWSARTGREDTGDLTTPIPLTRSRNSRVTCTAFSCQAFGAGRGVCLKSKQSAMPLDPLSRGLR